MKYLIRETLACILLVLISGSLRAQLFDSVLKKLDAEYPQEKLYLQFDKSSYTPGETIWFKAYLFAANFPSEISHTIYAELVDEQGKVIQKKNAPVFRYGAAAAFDLPTDLSGKYVYVRAYTRWMLNFDSSFIFLKGLPLLNSKKPVAKSVPVPASYALQFLPEGGDMVEGVESRVAFKGIDQNGYPTNFSGDVLDSKGKKVADVKVMHDGMGYFRLTPEAGEQYKCKWKDARGQMHETNLPVAKKEGVVLEANNTVAGIEFIIRRPANVSIPTPFQLVAQMQQQLLFRAKANLSTRAEVKSTLPTDNLASGIVQLTLFDQNDKPVAERLVFVNRQDYYFITDLNTAIKNITNRGKNVIRIDVPDTILANLSVSVTDADINPPLKDDEDIFSSVLLTSDIKGYVHRPGYYFSSEADSVAAHLDLVMMTNGWRRFSWDNVLAKQFPTIKYRPDNYLGIEGRIRGINKSEIKDRDITAILQPRKGGKQFVSIPIQPDGDFLLPDLLFYDTVKIFYQLNNDKDRTLTTRANWDFSTNLMRESIGTSLPPKQELYVVRPDSSVILKSKAATQKFIDQQRKVQTLATVEVTAKQKSRKDKIESEYTSGLFSGGDANTFILEDDPAALGYQDVFSYLQGKVAGLQIISNGGSVSLSWRGGNPALFLDEMQQQDASMLQSMPMSNVALIKVFKPPFIGAMGGGGSGAIAVYTKKGSSAYNDVKGLDFVNIAGYSPNKEFYSPDYEKDPELDKDDYRTTLYWNPFILTDKTNRKVMLTFFNNDISKRIRVVVEGMNAEGKLTRIEKIFE